MCRVVGRDGRFRDEPKGEFEWVMCQSSLGRSSAVYERDDGSRFTWADVYCHICRGKPAHRLTNGNGWCERHWIREQLRRLREQRDRLAKREAATRGAGND